MADTPSNQGQLEQLGAATEAAKQLGLELLRLDGSVVPSSEALALVSEKLAREYRLMPVSVDATTKQLILAVADPSLLASPAPSFLQELKQQGYTLLPKIAVPSEFEVALAVYGVIQKSAPTPGGIGAPTASVGEDRSQKIGVPAVQSATPDTVPTPTTVSIPADTKPATLPDAVPSLAPPSATPSTPTAPAPLSPVPLVPPVAVPPPVAASKTPVNPSSVSTPPVVKPATSVKVAANPAPNTSEEIVETITSQESVARPPVDQAKTAPDMESPKVDSRKSTVGEQIPASVNSTQVPTISLTDKVIPLAVLQRFPADVARKYKMVVFEVSPEEDAASVGAVNPGDRRVREILKFVQERNALAIRLYQITEADFTKAVTGYDQTAKPSEKPSGISPQASVGKEKTKTDQTLKAAPTPAPNTSKEIPTGIRTNQQESVASQPQIAAPKKPQSSVPAPWRAKAPAAPQPIVPVQRAAADKIREVAKQPAPVAAPPAPPKPVTPVPSPLAAAPATMPGKIGGVTPVSTGASQGGPVSAPTQYQQAVTRNSSAAPQANAQPLAALASPLAQTNAATPLAPTTVPLDDERNLDGMLGGVVSTPAQLEEIVKTGMVPRIIAAILSLAVSMEASDIHIESAREYVRVRLRVDGSLAEVIRVPTALLAPLVSRIKILSKLKIDESRVPQDGRFDVQVAGHEIDLRVSTLPTVHGEKVVMRLLDKSSALRKLEELGLVGTNLARVRGAINDPYGIILVTGPTGSGKTSTLYAMLSELNTASVNIVTLEDPVEYQVEGINQTQVKPAIGFSFADGLRSILRQDPNIVMVGEIRDKETAALATQAALTGHLVLSTLHTNDAAGAIPRMLDMGVEPFLLASSIKAVIGQRLIRKFSEGGSQPAALTPEVLAEVKSELDQGKAPEVIEAAGKQLQFQTLKGDGAYHGRLGIYEVLTISESISQLTLKKAPASAIADAALAEGMVTMRQDGILKAANGLTSLDEVLQATAEK